MRRQITLTVNGQRYTREVEPRLSLVDFLRDELGLVGTHVGCEQGVCGACTVRLNGATVRSCLLFAVQAHGAEVLTVEGLAGLAAAGGPVPAAGGLRLHPLQEAFWTHHGLQCGFCTPGMLLAALELLEENPHPTEEEIRVGLAGNLCMCTGYVNIVKAVRSAARVLRGEPPLPPGPDAGA
ncbi:MAG TPA: (2Fe-2S)-binding protein [Chloroflexota bacterium]|nr:(2Fe-2S)-binding protein [Chloroflexota bacterium]